MQNKILKTGILIMACFALMSFGVAASAQSVPTIQTNSATNIQTNSAALNANIVSLGGDNSSITVWFQWGTTTSYGSQTPQQSQSASGLFSQTITGLAANTTYHFQAAAQNRYGIVYGQDMTFYTGSNGQINVGGSGVQTNPATNILNNQATLNGNFGVPYLYNGTNYVWFQYGNDTNYGNQTPQQSMTGSTSTFSQLISNLSQNATYHFRAVMQNPSGTQYGQDMTFYTGQNGNGVINNYIGTGVLSVTKQDINLTSGNLNCQSSVNANPSDILSFAITLQAAGQDVHNVTLTDILSSNLIYKGNLLVNANMNYSGNPASGINIGLIPANGVVIVSYQAQVASGSNLVYGVPLNNNATVTSTEGGTQTASSQVLLNNQSYNINIPTNVSTGLTNNPITDSFFLPLFLIALGSWFYFSGNVYRFADWLGERIN